MSALYISSAPHSGSTLLDMVLGNLPGFFSTGELVMLPFEYHADRLCTCGSPVRRCDWWRGCLDEIDPGLQLDPSGQLRGWHLGWIQNAVHREGFLTEAYARQCSRAHHMRLLEYSLRLPTLHALSGRYYHQGIAETARLYRVISRRARGATVIDSTKHYLRALDLYRSGEVDGGMKIINLVRDGRAVFASMLRHGFSEARSLQVWKNHNQRSTAFFARHVRDQDLVTVRYEDLVQDTEATLAKVLAMTGHSHDLVKAWNQPKVHHNVNGNDTRFGQTFKLLLDERWKTQLSEAQLSRFHSECGSLNMSLGYSV